MFSGSCTTFQVSGGGMLGVVVKGTTGRIRRYVLFGSPMCTFGIMKQNRFPYFTIIKYRDA